MRNQFIKRFDLCLHLLFGWIIERKNLLMKKIAQNEAKNCFWYIAQHCNCLIKQEKQTMIYVMRISHRLPASCLWIVCGWSHIYIYCHIVPVARCHVPRDSHEEEARAEKCAMSQQQSIESLSVTRCFEVSETFFFDGAFNPQAISQIWLVGWKFLRKDESYHHHHHCQDGKGESEVCIIY